MNFSTAVCWAHQHSENLRDRGNSTRHQGQKTHGFLMFPVDSRWTPAAKPTQSWRVCQLSKPVPGISRCPAMSWDYTPGYPQQKIGEIQQQICGATSGSSKNLGI